MQDKSAKLRGGPYEEKVFDLGEAQPPEVVKRILMLEDDLDFTLLLKEFLVPQGFEITCVTNGADGLRKTMAVDFDIILCDMMMPTLPGDMFYMAVERIKPHLCKRFIFMTGYKGDPKYDAFVRKIKGWVLWKPFHLQDLQQTIDHILERTRTAATGV
jgi:CheY-like chemotaxis protein